METYRGIEGINIIYHGEIADPELEYDGMVVNYWDVENEMHSRYQEKMKFDNLSYGGGLTRYCIDNAEEVKNLIKELWEQSRK